MPPYPTTARIGEWSDSRPGFVDTDCHGHNDLPVAPRSGFITTSRRSSFPFRLSFPEMKTVTMMRAKPLVRSIIGCWTQQAACRLYPKSWWYPGDDYTGRDLMQQRDEAAKALRMCRERCPVREECFDHAMAYRELGIWGGTTERHRIRLRRQNGADHQNTPVVAGKRAS